MDDFRREFDYAFMELGRASKQIVMDSIERLLDSAVAKPGRYYILSATLTETDGQGEDGWRESIGPPEGERIMG